MKFLFLAFALCASFPLSASPVSSDSPNVAPDVKILFQTNGQITLGMHIYGKNTYTDLAPGYRSDMLLYTDLICYKQLTFNFLSGATTSIARLPETPIKMDKIRYTLSPGLRYPFKKAIATFLFFHECIHTISRDEKAGSAW